MLTIVLGNVGTGKTLFLVMLAKLSKIKVVSNFNLKFCYVKFDLEKFLKAEYDNCLILLDEAYAYLESRVSASELNRLMSYMLFQSRKKSLDLVLSAQLVSSLDKRFRRLANTLIICGVKTNVEFQYRITSRDYNRTITKILPYENAKRFFNEYDTNEIIRPENAEVENFFRKKLSGKDKMSQITIISDEIIEKYPDIRITKSLVGLYFTANDLPKFLEKDTYTFIKLTQKKAELEV